MSDLSVQTVSGTAAGLSQWQRILNVFFAPSKTFEDIRLGNSSWWLPFLLYVVIGTSLWFAVGSRVTWETVTENNLRMAPRQAEQLESLPADQQERQKAISATAQRFIWLGAPVFTLLMDLCAAGVLLGTINFGFGGKATFGKVLAVIWYGGLPGLLKLVIGLIGLYAGVAPESFVPGNPAGTNIGYYLNPADTNKAVFALATNLDPITIWSLVLTSIGLAIVAGRKRTDGLIAVFAWWVLLLAIGVVAGVIFS